MISKLKKILLGDAAFAVTADNEIDRQQLALAALLVEMARADFDENKDEHRLIVDLLSVHFELTTDEATTLLEHARAASDKAVCLFDFTRALHKSFDADEKQAVIRLLWQVANADNKLDKYEDFLVRKVADLLYVPHSDVIRLKHEVM